MNTFLSNYIQLSPGAGLNNSCIKISISYRGSCEGRDCQRASATGSATLGHSQKWSKDGRTPSLRITCAINPCIPLHQQLFPAWLGEAGGWADTQHTDIRNNISCLEKELLLFPGTPRDPGELALWFGSEHPQLCRGSKTTPFLPASRLTPYTIQRLCVFSSTWGLRSHSYLTFRPSVAVGRDSPFQQHIPAGASSQLFRDRHESAGRKSMHCPAMVALAGSQL